MGKETALDDACIFHSLCSIGQISWLSVSSSHAALSHHRVSNNLIIFRILRTVIGHKMQCSAAQWRHCQVMRI